MQPEDVIDRGPAATPRPGAGPGTVGPRLRQFWWLPALAVLLPLAFVLFTGHAWEDFFITLRSSRNLVEGNGLVFQPGERLHTFTSPLGVLIPAAGLWLADGSAEGALWFLRVVGFCALAAGLVLLWRRLLTLGIGALGRFVCCGLILADAKLTDFAINGMETALLVFFALWFWSELAAPAGPRLRTLGLAAAGLMWTRPDAFILGCAIALPHLLLRARDGSEPAIAWARLVRAALLAAALYLPWFLWAWWYYGSPVPHTIIAKAAFTPPVSWRDLLLLPFQTLTGQSMLVDLFLPTYWVFGGWPPLLVRLAQVLTAVVAFAWLVPGWAIAGRRASLALFIGMFYLCAIILFPWYLPPWSVLAAIVLGLALDAPAGRWPRLRPALRILGAVIVGVQVGIWLATAWQMRIQQEAVETGVRRQIGELLAREARPHDTVFMEPLGYIGYFSRMKTLDFPGLSSPEVVAAVRRGATSYSALITELKPDWVVLRPVEAQRADILRHRVLDDYILIKSWDARPRLNAVAYLPGRPWNEFEASFQLYRRRAPAEAAP